MGGVDHGHGEDFRTKVWSMTGGPNCRPKHWKRNTAIAMFGVFLICIPIAMKSAELEDLAGDIARLKINGLIIRFGQFLHSSGARILEIRNTDFSAAV